MTSFFRRIYTGRQFRDRLPERPTYAKVRHRNAVLGEKRVLSVHRNAEYHLSSRQIGRLVGAALTPRDRAIIILMVDTGLRRFEVCDLTIGDVDVREGLLTVRKGKGNRMRLVPLSARIAHLLSPLLAGPPESPLFRSDRGSALTTRQLNRIVANTGHRSGLCNPNPQYTNITCHLLRHTFARHWKDVGGSIETLAKILGHASVKTTWDLYGTQSIKDIKRNYNRIITKITSTQAIEEE